MLEHKADIEAKDKKEGMTALVLAAEKGHADAVRVLLEHKADIKAKDGWGRTAMQYASALHRSEVVKVLKAAVEVLKAAAAQKERA